MAGETLIKISRDDIERARLLSEEKYILDNQNLRVHAMREGQKKGLAQAKLEIARNLKAAGIHADIIFKTTGLNPDDL